MDLINEMLETLRKLEDQAQELSKAVYAGPWKFKDIKERVQEQGYDVIGSLARARITVEDMQESLARYHMIERAVDDAFSIINQNSDL